MDPRRFDAFVQTLGTAAPRRRALAALLTWLGAPLLPDLTAEAKRKRPKRRGKGKDHGKDRGHARGNATHQASPKGRKKGKHRGKRKGKGKSTRRSQRKPTKCTPNAACAQWCASTFGEDTPEAGQCTSAATSCQGPCFECGPGCGNACGKTRCGSACIDPCEASDPCRVAECDPENGACIDRPADDDTPCHDDPCTVDGVCRDGECLGTPKDCSEKGDACNDGVCQDGACVKRPKANGTSCNADNDSCTVGDSCQNGVCTSGGSIDCSGVSDACNTGVCRQSDGTCIKQPKGNGTPCGASRECVGGICEVVCLASNAVCDPEDDTCCGDEGAFCSESAACAAGGEAGRCCRPDGEICARNCDCCDGVCAGGVCCQPNRQCNSTGDCCEGHSCVNNVCTPACGTRNAFCGTGPGQFPCCEGFRCFQGECWPETCLAPTEQCTSANQCCSDGVIACEPSRPGGDAICCHPYNATCQDTDECCGTRVCGPRSKCCLGSFFDADRPQPESCIGREHECCPGRRCNPLNGACCLAEGQPVPPENLGGVIDCCHFTEENGVCSCQTDGESCAAPFGPFGPTSCCDGLWCVDGRCELPCTLPGFTCGSGSLPCCRGFTCNNGLCL
jgi:hypothetical protein